MLAIVPTSPSNLLIMIHDGIMNAKKTLCQSYMRHQQLRLLMQEHSDGLVSVHIYL